MNHQRNIDSIITSESSFTAKSASSSAFRVWSIESNAGGRSRFQEALEVEAGFGSLPLDVEVDPSIHFQTISGIGGSFTEASAFLFHQMSPENQELLISAYFGEEGARYSLARTHINSCDFALGNYAYIEACTQTGMSDFSIERDLKYLIPMIKAAMRIAPQGIRLIGSPWTAPPSMKDNNSWVGGRLKPECQAAWASYLVKYFDAYKNHGIEFWGMTIENEPLGNGENWESMHYTASEMHAFTTQFLGPLLRRSHPQIKILGFDQNRDEYLAQWVDEMYKDDAGKTYFDGTAVHWYASTYDVFPDALDYAKSVAPTKHLIQTEGCIDAEVPRWKQNDWYWSGSATDWGYTWAPEDLKHYHTPYIPVHRYAADLIGCFNHGVDGWIDWNLVLDRQGGPNWAKNWCTAPVIYDPMSDELYFTPLYDVMYHFSRYIGPGSTRIGWTKNTQYTQITAFLNEKSDIIVVLFNPSLESESVRVGIKGQCTFSLTMAPQSLRTMVINKD